MGVESEPRVGGRAFGWGEGASGWCSGGVWVQCWEAWGDIVHALCGPEYPDAGIRLASDALSGCTATPAGCGAGSRSWPSVGMTGFACGVLVFRVLFCVCVMVRLRLLE
jgi:hypothetical protein